MLNNFRCIDTTKCNRLHTAVCMTEPLYSPPDFPCPREFYPYKGQCLYPDQRDATYEDAMVIIRAKTI